MSGPLPEPEVVTPTSRPVWIALLAGPSLWWGHFMAVYLLAEVVCEVGAAGPAWLGLTAFGWAVVAATAGALVATGVAARRTWTYRPEVEPSIDVLLLVGIGLDGLFALAIIATAAPVLWLRPC
ncbi:hypothetical protein [Euzebya sp.]|uniref:hypothetical protein n=1 Tax=Euzebya sp. TaxID=1971409 RepID=UPI003511B2FE